MASSHYVVKKSINHIVLFSFKPEASAEDVKKAVLGMLNLKDKCLHHSSQQPYIQAITGGKDNSPEGFQQGITHAFVVHFENAEHRDYYIKEDPAHQAFVGSILPIVSKLQVVDYTPGEF